MSCAVSCLYALSVSLHIRSVLVPIIYSNEGLNISLLTSYFNGCMEMLHHNYGKVDLKEELTVRVAMKGSQTPESSKTRLQGMSDRRWQLYITYSSTIQLYCPSNTN